MPLKTSISLARTDDPKPSPHQVKLHNPSGTQPNHVLYIELASIALQRPLEVPKLEENHEFLVSIRDAVTSSQESNGGTQIDAISISYTPDTPNAELWEALAQARASHLEFNPHYELFTWDGEERCNYAGLGRLSLESGAWPLKSLYLDAYRGDGAWNYAEGAEQKPSLPAIFANIETLVLLSPDKDSLYFYPEGGAANLRSLTIINGASLETFTRTVGCNPRIADTLVSLTLLCRLPQRSGCGRRMKELFKEGIRSLQRFELEAVDDSHFKRPAEYLTGLNGFARFGETMEDCANACLLGLSTVLPSSLVTLLYKGPANSLMLQDLDQWVEDAVSPSWLPNLRTVAFELVPLQGMKESKNLGEDQMEQLKQKLEKFWALLRQRHPPVAVVNPRDKEELKFPLSI